MTALAAGEMEVGDWLGVLGYSFARFTVSGAGSGLFVLDLPIEPTIEDYLAGRDPMMEAILADSDER